MMYSLKYICIQIVGFLHNKINEMQKKTIGGNNGSIKSIKENEFQNSILSKTRSINLVR